MYQEMRSWEHGSERAHHSSIILYGRSITKLRDKTCFPTIHIAKFKFILKLSPQCHIFLVSVFRANKQSYESARLTLKRFLRYHDRQNSMFSSVPVIPPRHALRRPQHVLQCRDHFYNIALHTLL